LQLKFEDRQIWTAEIHHRFCFSLGQCIGTRPPIVPPETRIHLGARRHHLSDGTPQLQLEFEDRQIWTAEVSGRFVVRWCSQELLRCWRQVAKDRDQVEGLPATAEVVIRANLLKRESERQCPFFEIHQ